MTHKGITSSIVRDIVTQLKLYMESDITDDVVIDLPDNDDLFSIKSYGNIQYFTVELFLFKTNEENYKIIGDAPGDDDEDNIRIGIYANPKNYKSKLSEIYFNLIYTFRHEFEHLLQVISGYNRINKIYYDKNFKKYRGDSLATLLKPQEIEPQILGYHLQSKKENKSFEDVISQHLDKLLANGQITFKSRNRRDILINQLKESAKLHKLNFQ